MKQENKSLNVVLCTTEYLGKYGFDGGLAQYTKKAAHGLRKNGHRPIVLLSTLHDSGIEVVEGIEVHIIKVNRNLGYWLLNAFTAFLFNPVLLFYLRSRSVNHYILKHQNQLQPDVIHYSSSMCLGYKPIKGIPSCVRVSSVLRDINISGSYKRNFRMKMKEWLFDRMINNNEHVFVPSTRLQKLFKSEYGKEVELVHTPLNKFEGNYDFSLLKAVSNKTKNYLLFFGTMHTIKGCIEISQMLDRLFSNYDVDLVFVGKSGFGTAPGNMRQVFEEQNAKWIGRMHFFDPVSHDKLFPVIRCARGVLMPSRTDNFPNTCIEAMAQSRIVLGTYQAGFDQIITDGKNGMLCNNYDPDDLYQKTAQLLSLPTKVKLRMQQTAFSTTGFYISNRPYEELIKYYQKLPK